MVGSTFPSAYLLRSVMTVLRHHSVSTTERGASEWYGIARFGPPTRTPTTGDTTWLRPEMGARYRRRWVRPTPARYPAIWGGCGARDVPFPDGSGTCWWPSILSFVSATTSTKFRGWRARQVQWCSCRENASRRVERARVRYPRPSSRLATGLLLPVGSARQTLSAD
jgi:hypothetical protein